MTPQNLSRICRELCKAKCCKYISVAIDPPTRRIDREEIRWFLCHKDISVRFERRRWYVQVETRCEKLGPDNSCTIYDTRPDICRQYEHRECDHLGSDDEGTLVFTTPEQFQAFLAQRDERRRQARRGRAAGRTRKRPRKS